MNKLHNVETLELDNIVSKGIQKSTEINLEVCEALVELKRRGELRPVMFKGFFKWFEPLAAGTLYPELVTLFSGEDQLIRRFIGLPMRQQKEIAETGTVKFVIDKKGDLVEIDKEIVSMNERQLDQVFHDGKMRTFTQQAKIVRAPPPKLPAPAPLIAVDGGLLVIAGKHSIEPSALIEPLRALGFTIMKRKPE